MYKRKSEADRILRKEIDYYITEVNKAYESFKVQDTANPWIKTVDIKLAVRDVKILEVSKLLVSFGRSDTAS